MNGAASAFVTMALGQTADCDEERSEHDRRRGAKDETRLAARRRRQDLDRPDRLLANHPGRPARWSRRRHSRPLAGARAERRRPVQSERSTETQEEQGQAAQGDEDIERRSAVGGNLGAFGRRCGGDLLPVRIGLPERVDVCERCFAVAVTSASVRASIASGFTGRQFLHPDLAPRQRALPPDVTEKHRMKPYRAISTDDHT